MAEEPAGSPSSTEELLDPDARKSDSVDQILDKPIPTNDPKALKKKGLSDKARDLEQEADLRTVLATVQGVRFMARLIEACGWNQPYFHPSNSFMCEIAGRRSIAYQLEQWISDADLALWIRVRSELEKSRPKPKSSEKR